MKPTITQVLKGTAIAAVVSIVLNEIWDLIGVNLLNLENPKNDFAIRIVVSSLLPTLIGGLLYFLLEKYTSKGKLIFQVVAIAFTLLSLYSSFMKTWPDGTVVADNFWLLSIPMHLIAGLSAAFLIPKFSK
jgi:predicted Na+-dependent transporter